MAERKRRPPKVVSEQKPVRKLKVSATETKARYMRIATLSIDGKTDTQIAEELGVTHSTVGSMRERPAYKDAEKEALEALKERLYAIAGASRVIRTKILNDQLYALLAIVEERKSHPDYQDHPGAATGRMRVHRKSVGAGQNFSIIEEWAVDEALLKEIRATISELREETGQSQKAGDMHGVIHWTLDPGRTIGGDIVEAEFSESDDSPDALPPPDDADEDSESVW